MQYLLLQRWKGFNFEPKLRPFYQVMRKKLMKRRKKIFTSKLIKFWKILTATYSKGKNFDIEDRQDTCIWKNHNIYLLKDIVALYMNEVELKFKQNSERIS